MCHKDTFDVSRCACQSHLPIWGREGVNDKGERQTGMGGNVDKFRLKLLCGTKSQIH